MNLRQNLFFVLSLTVLLTACGDKGDLSVQYSDAGLIPEVYLPGDVGLVVSYSTRSDEQYSAIQALETNLGDADRISQTASEGLDAQLGSVGLDFERDLKPAFGERFRMVFALRPTNNTLNTNGATTGDPETFTVVTLEAPDKMENVLTTLSDAGQLAYKKLSDIDAYVSTDSTVYLTVMDDLLLVASTPEDLVGMTEQDEDTSLWNADLYKETLDEVGPDYAMFGVMYPSLYSEDLSLLAGFSVSDIPEVVDKEVVVIRAEQEGLRFEAWVNANKSKAKEAGIAFDSVPKSEPYLFNEIPSDGLLAYFESYGLSQTFMKADELGDDTGSLDQMKEATRNYFGMEFEDVMSFLDKGYAMSLHQNGDSPIPGITIYVDTSSNPENVKTFVDKLDGQLSGLLLLAETYIPGALTKDTVSWGDSTFARLKLDLNAVAQLSGGSLPAELTENTIELVYGVEDKRLVFSTATGWDSEAETIVDSTLYKDLDAQLSEQKEGLILVDAQGLSDYLKKLQALSGELDAEKADQLASAEDFLSGFVGLMARSQTEAYESHFGGFLMLAK